MKKATWALGRQRLLFLADVLDIADKGHKLVDERTYDQKMFVHPCGAPACALGHYAAQFPRKFKLKPARGDDGSWNDPFLGAIVPTGATDPGVLQTGIGVEGYEVTREFAITQSEAAELFADDGCDGAKKAVDAANYIRNFVRRKDRKMRAARTMRIVRAKAKARRR